MAENQSIPIYRWEPWPEGMATKKQLAAKKLRPGPVAGKIPYSKSSTGDGWLYVYRESEATPAPPPTPKQQAAREKLLKARTCIKCGRVVGKKSHLLWGHWCISCAFPREQRHAKIDAIRWARRVLTQDLVVLDTETTSLDTSYAEIIAITVVSGAGEKLLDTYVKPERRIAETIYEQDDEEWALTSFFVNGISNAMVADAPGWPEVFPRLVEATQGKLIVAYNVDFDRRVIRGHRLRYNLPKLTNEWECAMLAFAKFAGGWNDYHQDWRWLALSVACHEFGIDTSASHTSGGDALGTLALIKAMSFQ